MSFQTIPPAWLKRFREGRTTDAWRWLGAHACDEGGDVHFAVWAPAASRVSVAGDFNGWNVHTHALQRDDESGVWQARIHGVTHGCRYKFSIGDPCSPLKSDPFARWHECRPGSASRLHATPPWRWQDDVWMAARLTRDSRCSPVTIYEVHAGSWRRNRDGGWMGYRQLAHALADHVRECGFTHVQLLPLTEHLLDESWGYQVLGYFSPTSRFGDPDDLRYFVDYLHRAGIGVILDWVPGHFPRDDTGLRRFDGQPLYEHPDTRLGEHRQWGTLVFDYARNEVANLLLSSAAYWLSEFHFDGLRVDAVASMIYADYDRAPGEWLPDPAGGNHHPAAISFLRTLNVEMHREFPGVLIIAEESTAWPGVSAPVHHGGLGFGFKWNMGWMHDTLAYWQHEPVHRRWHHDHLTFSRLYAFSENFVLPLSHDEVVHGKGSLLSRMPGDEWQRFAHYRLLMVWLFTHPGKPLLFMGGEFAQSNEWNALGELDWWLLDHAPHAAILALVRALNTLTRDLPALHENDCEPQGFAWIDCHDAECSVLAFSRHASECTLLCCFNFTPVPRAGHVFHGLAPGRYHVMLDSDARHFHGSDYRAGLAEHTVTADGRLTLDLAPLAAVLLLQEAA